MKVCKSIFAPFGISLLYILKFSKECLLAYSSLSFLYDFLMLYSFLSRLNLELNPSLLQRLFMFLQFKVLLKTLLSNGGGQSIAGIVAPQS